MSTPAFTITGGQRLRARLRMPGDKSISHRALLLGALAEGSSTVSNLSAGEDVRRTATAIEMLGATVTGDLMAGGRITGGRQVLHEAEAVVDAGNSGTTMRLLAGMCAGFGWLTVLAGDRSLSRRPMDRVAEPLRAMGAGVDGRGATLMPPLVVRGGGLRGIEHTPAVASAQVKSAVLLAGLSAEGETVVNERVRTRTHTEDMLAECGADIDAEDHGDERTVRLRPSRLRPFEIEIPGDPSQAAFWVVAASIIPDSDVVVEDVELGPARAGFIEVLRRMGASVDVEWKAGHRGDIVARHSGEGLTATEVGGAEMVSVIDEIPALAIAAAVAKGTTVFRDAAELRVKESDRIAGLVSQLGQFGVAVEEQPDGLVINGGARLKGAAVRSLGDHRLAMAFAIAGLAADGTTEIQGWEAVATSYPRFEDDLRACLS